jgi:hypothetical protein
MILTAVSCLVAAPALAQAPCPVTYPQFYAAVAHVDLPACPQALEGPHRFCRMVENENGQHVFVFTVEGAQCLVETRRFDAGQLAPMRLASAN